MVRDYTYIDRYSAVALNLIAGHRATEGNQNAPENIGVFMEDLPADTRLNSVDQATGGTRSRSRGVVLRERPGALRNPAVRAAHRRDAGAGGGGGRRRRRLLGSRALRQGTPRAHRHPDLGGRGPGGARGTVGYAFLDATLLNLAYWGGETGVYVQDFPPVSSLTPGTPTVELQQLEVPGG